jgi:hypothetical protein
VISVLFAIDLALVLLMMALFRRLGREEGAVKIVGEIVRSTNQSHARIQRKLGTLRVRARKREAYIRVLANLVAAQRKIMSKLHNDEDQRKTTEATPPVSRAEIPSPPLTDELEPGAAGPDARPTVESPPPSTRQDGDENEDEQTVVMTRPPAACKGGL